MHYLVSVIADGTEVALPGQMAAIDAFNDDRHKAEVLRMARSSRTIRSSPARQRQTGRSFPGLEHDP